MHIRGMVMKNGCILLMIWRTNGRGGIDGVGSAICMGLFPVNERTHFYCSERN